MVRRIVGRYRPASTSQSSTRAAVWSLFGFAQQIADCENSALNFDLSRNERNLSLRIISEEDVRRMIALEPDVRNPALPALLFAAGLLVAEACGLAVAKRLSPSRCWVDYSCGQGQADSLNRRAISGLGSSSRFAWRSKIIRTSVRFQDRQVSRPITSAA
jgi:site-specific recombinase XerD